MLEYSFIEHDLSGLADKNITPSIRTGIRRRKIRNRMWWDSSSRKIIIKRKRKKKRKVNSSTRIVSGVRRRGRIKEEEREEEKGYDGWTTRDNGDEDKVQDEVTIMENSSL